MPAHTGVLTPPPTPPHTAARLPARQGTGSSSSSSIRTRPGGDLLPSASSGSIPLAAHTPSCPLYTRPSPTEFADEEDDGPLGPLPSAPRFDVHQAAAACKANTGYVAFAELEGLGVPPAGLDGDESERDAAKEAAKARRRSGVGRGIAKVLAWWGSGAPGVPAGMA
jgi:hypothetical protein